MTAPRRLNIVARLTRALEAFRDGDQALAVRIVEDLRRELEREPVQRPYRCVNCGETFAWPGLLDHHRRFSSCGLRAKAATGGAG